MTRTLYFDGFAGISGDMAIGALLDLGVDLESLRRQLATLELPGYELAVSRVRRSGIAATKFDVVVEDAAPPHRHLTDIVQLIVKSQLSARTKARAIHTFRLLGEAEAKVHGTTVEQVHFHEVGAVDSIIDVVGVMIGIELIGVEQFFASPLRVGKGVVRMAHGVMPIPAPGTAEILRGVPIYAGEWEGEFVTPTGAAIVKSLCQSFVPLPQVKIEAIGYGAGTRDPQGFPNALRLLLCEPGSQSEDATDDKSKAIVVIETNIDDMNPQAYGQVMQRAFAEGALDVFLTAVQMKKDRPGVLLTVLCDEPQREALIDLLLRETTTLGVRYYEAQRQVLERAIEAVETEYGVVRIKVARKAGDTVHFQPEFEDCARLALAARVSFVEVQRAAEAAFREQLKLRTVQT